MPSWRAWLLLVLTVLMPATGAAQRPAAPPRTAPPPRVSEAVPGAVAAALVLQGGTLVNPGRPPIPNAVVVVRGSRVVCAARAAACAIPRGARAVSVKGLFVAPGLMDAHVHYSQTGWVDGRPDAVDLRASYPYDSVVADLAAHPERFHRAWLCSGVTGVFDVGGYAWTLDLAKRTVEASDAPRVRAAGPLLSTIDHWVTLPVEPQFVPMRSDSIVRASVRALARLGSAAVKVWNIPVPDTLTPRMADLLMAAGDESRKAGMPLIVHATSLAKAREAVAAGASVLVHNVFEDTVDQAFVESVRQRGIIVVPTLTVLEGYADVRFGRSTAERYPLDCVDSLTRSRLEHPLPESVRLPRPEAGERMRRRLEEAATISPENLRRLYAAHVAIAAGTDAGNPGTAHGPSLYRELD
ncbi:MAG TPA: hypothetical protein VFK09_10905, partial [Gemmatimonadales bacterium]|nr:hypothetical protein [Gemmatimonadales bacterium]